MKLILWIYLGLLLAFGIYSGRRDGDYDTFTIGGHRQIGAITFFSLMATMIGGSATLGIAATGYEIGFPVFWWLGVGSVGLLLQALFVSAKVRELNVHTLAEVGKKTVGNKAAVVIAVVIAVAWVGIIAGQFVALSQIFAVLTGGEQNGLLIAVAAATVILFTCAGGQISVMRTDAVYFFFIIIGVAATFLLLYFGGGEPVPLREHVRLFNADFTPKDLVLLTFVVGGAYFIGPDVLSRSMAAKDGKTARRASLAAAAILLLFNVIIVLVVLWTKLHLDDTHGLNPLIALMELTLPRPVALLLALGLISALLSSASTCLITAASTIQNDIIKKESVAAIRGLTLLIGAFATVIALKNSDIIAILTAAYTIYAPGLVPPLFIAITTYGKRPINEKTWLTAVTTGATTGLTAQLLHYAYLPLIAITASTLIALLSIRKRQ